MARTNAHSATAQFFVNLKDPLPRLGIHGRATPSFGGDRWLDVVDRSRPCRRERGPTRTCLTPVVTRACGRGSAPRRPAGAASSPPRRSPPGSPRRSPLPAVRPGARVRPRRRASLAGFRSLPPGVGTPPWTRRTSPVASSPERAEGPLPLPQALPALPRENGTGDGPPTGFGLSPPRTHQPCQAGEAPTARFLEVSRG